MAKLDVSTKLITDVLFPGEFVSIAGASFDGIREVITLNIEGHTVPKCDRVTCMITEERKTFKFDPVDES